MLEFLCEADFQTLIEPPTFFDIFSHFRPTQPKSTRLSISIAIFEAWN